MGETNHGAAAGESSKRCHTASYARCGRGWVLSGCRVLFGVLVSDAISRPHPRGLPGGNRVLDRGWSPAVRPLARARRDVRARRVGSGSSSSGLPAVVFGFVVTYLLADRPETAWWLDRQEKETRACSPRSL